MVKLTRGERFKQIREERGFKTQQEVLDACGVQKSMLSALENDESCRDVGFSHIVKLSALYGVSLDWLFGRSEIRSVDADVQAACKFTGLGQEALQNISLKIKSEPLMADLLNHLFTDIGFLDCLDKLLDYYIVYVNELNAERKPASWAECSNPNGSWRVKDVLNWQHQMDALSQLSDFPKYDMSEIIRYKVVEAFNAVLDRLEV